MKERYKHILVGLVLASVLFYCGFYLGNKKGNTILRESDNFSVANMDPFWKAWKVLDEKFSKVSSTSPNVSAEDKVWGAIDGLARSYGDPYTVFFPPKENKMFEEEISGSFSGVGMEIGIQDGVLTVISPIKNTPAFRAGVKSGDKIFKINERPALDLSTDEAIQLIRGESGTSVVITFIRNGVKEPIVKTIIRESIEIPTVSTKILPEGVFLIELYNFSAVSPNLFRQSLREFVESGTNKLIIDLRNNPGGFLEASLDMASWFLPTGKVVVTEDFGGKQDNIVYKSKGYDVFNDNLKMVILVNQGSASASEILAGALKEYNKAVLVGEKTFGKGSVQELVSITDKTSLKITVAHWFTPLGHSISEQGLKPDIEVKLTPENTKNGADPQLKSAIDYLLNKK